MTAKSDFTPQEWELVVEGPPSAAVVVIMAMHGGELRKTFVIAKAYDEARKVRGQSELLDEIVAASPEVDHARYHSRGELETHVLSHLRDTITLLERKASPGEVEAYRRFVLELVSRVAGKERAGTRGRSQAVRAAIDHVSASLGQPAV